MDSTDLYVNEAMIVIERNYPDFHRTLDSVTKIIVMGAIRSGIEAALFQQRLEHAHLVANADNEKQAVIAILTER